MTLDVNGLSLSLKDLSSCVCVCVSHVLVIFFVDDYGAASLIYPQTPFLINKVPI